MEPRSASSSTEMTDLKADWLRGADMMAMPPALFVETDEDQGADNDPRRDPGRIAGRGAVSDNLLWSRLG